MIFGAADDVNKPKRTMMTWHMQAIEALAPWYGLIEVDDQSDPAYTVTGTTTKIRIEHWLKLILLE